MMKQILTALLMSSTLFGCAMLNNISADNGQNSQSLPYEDSLAPLESSIVFQQHFKQNIHQRAEQIPQQQDEIELQETLLKQNTHQLKEYDINYYARGLMQDLVANLQYVNSTTPVAVVSFVMLDSNYNEANLLGIQIAESLIHEVHKFGIPVIDFKTTGYIRVTEQGDFAFSKDYSDLSAEMPVRYIVGGTLLKNKTGYLVNARVVGLQSQAVVASAQSFIPNNVADPILMTTSVESEENMLEEQTVNEMTVNQKSNIVYLTQE